MNLTDSNVWMKQEVNAYFCIGFNERYGYQEFKSKKDVAEILIHNLRSDVLKSYIFGGSEDVVYKYIKNNRSKGTPSEIISKGFDIVKKALGEKFNFEFV